MARPYEIILLTEKTLAWWRWRQTGVGSSDAAAILGEKRARSTERLLLEKQQPVTESRRTFTQARGAAIERAARARYCETMGLSVAPACVQSMARPWQRASLDGISGDGERVVEIKCGAATYQSVAARQRPPRHHYAQLQHILSVTELPVLDYWCYTPSHAPLRLEVRRDDAFVARLLAAEEEFWKRLEATPGK